MSREFSAIIPMPESVAAKLGEQAEPTARERVLEWLRQQGVSAPEELELLEGEEAEQATADLSAEFSPEVRLYAYRGRA